MHLNVFTDPAFTLIDSKRLFDVIQNRKMTSATLCRKANYICEITMKQDKILNHYRRDNYNINHQYVYYT